MRRLITIALLLWLPLQAWAAVFATSNSSYSWATNVGMTEATVEHTPCEHTLRAPPPAPSATASDSSVQLHLCAMDMDEQGGTPCSDGIQCCAVAGAASLTPAAAAAAARSTPASRDATAWPHRDENFSSAPANPALKPPIPAA